MPIKATILLPNYNNERVLPITFEYLRRNVDCKDVRFVMVDDGSEDASVAVAKREVVKCEFASVEIIELKHEGIVTALNTGLDAIKTEYVLRIDGDATVETPSWALRLVSHLEAWPEIGIVGGHVIWETGRVHSLGRSVVSEIGLHDMGTIPLEGVGCRTLDSTVYKPKYLPANWSHGPYEVDTVLGVCVAFRSKEAHDLGGFDMRFSPVWIEDDDFGLALRQIGKRVLIDPLVKTTHRPSLRGSRQPGSGRRKLFRSCASFVKNSVSSMLHRSERALNALVSGGTPDELMEKAFPDAPNSWRLSILISHYAKWKEKWGFDPINPDMHLIHERYWDSSLCWRLNPEQFEKSRMFLRNLN